MWWVIGAIIGRLLDPVSFIIVLVISTFSRKKWVILVAAITGAVVTETILTSSQFTRTWGEGLVYGFIASGLHALICYWVIGKFKKLKTKKENSKLETSIEKSETSSNESMENTNPIDSVAKHLRVMGYDLTPYGAGVALLEIQSGYNEVETASHIALTTMALDIRGAGKSAKKLISFFLHGHSLLKVLKNYKDQNMMHPAQWQNDSNAVFRLSTIDENQEEWLEKILSDPIAGKERLATSRIDYNQKN